MPKKGRKRNLINKKKDHHFHAPQPQQPHNPDEGTCFYCTPGGWIKFLQFYTVFCLVLAGLCTLCLVALLVTCVSKAPKCKLEESLIGKNPGLGFRPISEGTFSSLIQFDSEKYLEQKYWIHLLDKYMEAYNHSSYFGKQCFFVCAVNINQFGSCIHENAYGYRNSEPCVFLKLNKNFNCVPQYYNNTFDLPLNIRVELKKYIKQTEALKRQQIWVCCNGNNAEDKENFPNNYSPYLNQPGYLSLLITIQFKSLLFNKMVNIECRAWAKNVIYTGGAREWLGSITFQILMD